MAHEFAARGFVWRNYSRSRSIGYLLNGQLQDKLLSACKISQAFPGTQTWRYSARKAMTGSTFVARRAGT